VIEVDDVRVGIDTWDGTPPSWPGHPILESLQLLLKIEWRPAAIWGDLETKYGIRVSPWTMFGYEHGEFPPSYFQWSPDGHRFLYGFSGDAKRPKHAWLAFMRERGMPVYGIQEPSDYLALIPQLRWGVILQGRRSRDTDGKNRREPAYPSCGIPLALNYEPHYPFEMRPGRDYVFLKEPQDLDMLADIDPTPFAEASSRLWDLYFSPRGMAATLLELVNGLAPNGRRRKKNIDGTLA